MSRRRMETVRALRHHLANEVRPRRKVRQPARTWSPVVQPQEIAPRNPADRFDYGGETTLAQAAAVVTLVQFVVPGHVVGTLKELWLYGTLPAAIRDLTEWDLTVDSVSQRGLLGQALAAASVLAPDGALEPALLKFNIKLTHGQTIAVTAGRVAAVDPASYTYRARVRGWYWPRRP